MSTASQGKEIVVEVFNEIGVLFNLSKIVSEKGVNILALCGDVHGANAVIRLLTDDNLRAVDALRKHKFDAREHDVVVANVAHRPGMLRTLTERLGQEQGIDIQHIYASASADASRCLLVLSCTDNQRAAVVLNELIS
jgi:hypothetical protein